jgi:hypothetical protein
VSLPVSVIDPLILTVEEAVDLAHAGQVADGYQVLLIGKARSLEGEKNFEAWAEELDRLWSGAIERYAERWGVGRG